MSTPNLAMIPCGYKAGKLYSALPTDGSGDFTVARASKKHIVNSDLELEIIDNNIPAFNYGAIGGCPFLNTEPQATNLITYPISFGNPYWTKSGASIEGDPSTAGAEQVTNGGFATDTDWNKGAGWTISGGKAVFTSASADIYQSVVWEIDKTYLVTVDYTFTAGTRLILPYDGTNQAGVITSFGSGTISYYYTPKSANLYIYTDTNSTGTIDNVSVKEVQGYSAPSVNFPTSAFKLVESAAAATQHRLVTGSTSVTSGLKYTESVFVKDFSGNRKIQLNNDAAGINSYFDLTTLAITNVGGVGKYTAMADGWYKFEVTGTAISTGAANTYIALANPTETYTGDGTSGVYIFMAQLEQGSVATSPTFTDTTLASEGSTTTRLVDVVSGAGDTTLYSGLNASGVLFIHSRALSNVGTDRGFTLSDGTTNNRVKIYYDIGGGDINVFVYNEADLQCLFTFSATITDWHKIAIRWAVNDFSLWVDGVEVGTDTSGTIFAANILSDLSFNDNGNDNFFADINSVKTLSYQTDSEMATLTTL